MMQKSHIFPEFPADDSQDLRRAREFPRIFPGFSDKVRRRRRPGLERTTPEAWCMLHRSLVRDPLNPRACPTEAYPGELIPGNESRIIPPSFVTQVICVWP